MTRCRIQRGVFALRPCPNESLMVCQTCNRPACGEHTAQSSPPQCSECHARYIEHEYQRKAAHGPVRRRRWEDDDYLHYSYRSWLWNDAIHTSHHHHHHDDDDEDDRGEVGDAIGDEAASAEVDDDLFGDADGDDFDDGGGDDDAGFGDS